MLAPSLSDTHTSRTSFFISLDQLPPPTVPLILARDLNCVFSPHFDRNQTLPPRRPHPECVAIELWLKYRHLHDCLWQTCPTPTADSTTRALRQRTHTCIRPQANSSSRFDRIYISTPIRCILRQHTSPPANAVTTTPSLPSIPPDKSLPLKGPRSDISHTFGPSIHLEQTILRYITEAARDFPPFSGIAPTGTPSPRSFIQCLLLDLRTAESPPAAAQLPIHTQAQRLHTIDAYAHQIAEINCYKHGLSMLEGTPINSFRPPVHQPLNNTVIPFILVSVLTSRHPRRPMGSSTSAHSAFLTAVTDRLTPVIRSPRIPPAVRTQ
ncbi:hypothetical protein DYB37_010899 [Aphanomyces astaci]|uniref:Uncharacterized protein n=1 Tax=Aphanomyces astaci TaxID=112090 RepID=A0A3R7ASX5_APHAT|nr:hypothetical protein DYB35_010634 [Aphanomyces astaci]RHZ11290.1 hypothetical protein DYB37_010899 [Aphanomyces astaci]